MNTFVDIILSFGQFTVNMGPPQVFAQGSELALEVDLSDNRPFLFPPHLSGSQMDQASPGVRVRKKHIYESKGRVQLNQSWLTST